MRRLICSVFILPTLMATAGIPDPVITTTSASGGYATVAGRLAVKPDSPVGISVVNGNLSYSTLTDNEGRWGIIISYRDTSLAVHSWSLSNPGQRSQPVLSSVDPMQ